MMRIAIVVLGLAVAQASTTNEVSKNDDNKDIERRRLSSLTPWEIEQLSSIFDSSSSEEEAAYYYTYGHDAGLAAQALRQSEVDAEATTIDDDDEELCNYAPSIFNFEMDLQKNCNDETLSNNVGIDGSICFYTYGADDDASADDVIAESNPFGSRRRRALRVSGKDDTNGIVEKSSSVNHRIKDKNNSTNMKRLLDVVPDISSHIKHAQDTIDTHQHNEQRIMQTKDPVPTKITSVTFVEFDNKIADIINQNSTYFDTELYDGDKITYPSIASKIDNTIPLSEQTDLLPGGIMLILFGINKDNVIVRNTIAWAYKLNDCIPVESQGDTIGWVKVDNYTPPVVLPLVVETESPTTSSPVEPVVTPSPVTPAPVPYPTMPPVRHVPVAKSVKSNKSSKGKSGKGKSSKGESHSMSYPVHHTYHAKSTKSAKAFGHAGKSTKAYHATTKVATYDPKAQKISTKSVKAEKMFTKSGKAFGKSSGKASHVARPVAFTTSSTGVMSVSMEARGEDYYDPYMGLVSDESMSMDTAPWE